MADTSFSFFDLADALESSYEHDEVEIDSCVQRHPKAESCDHDEECELHSGVHLEVSEEPHSLRQVVNLVIALQRMKTKQVQSTEFSDDELCSILLDNLVEEYVTPRVHERTHKAPDRYTYTGSNRKCVICDEFQKSLVLRGGARKELQAITLQGANMSLRVKLDLCSYVPSIPREEGTPVVLGVPGNLYLSCTADSGTPALSLEMINKETLQDISGDLKRFLFFKTSSQQALSSFESAKFEGYFISTSYNNRQCVDVCQSLDAPNRLTSFNIIDV